MTGFFDIRWTMYGKRREAMLQALRQDLVICSAKVRFITELIEETIRVFNVKREDVIATLTERGYPKKDDGYDYLTRMPISSLTRERKDELLAEEAEQRKTLTELENTSVADMWNRDLDAFDKEYTKFVEARRKAAEEDADAPSTKGKRKTPAKK
jgi:DNA topoisomerase-2